MRTQAKKDRLLNVRVSETEFNYLIKVSDELDMSISAVMRGFIDFFLIEEKRRTANENKQDDK